MKKIYVIYAEKPMLKVGNNIKDENFEFIHVYAKEESIIIDKAIDADGIILQYAPMTNKSIDKLKNLKVIVRTGIGMDNVNVEAATQKGIQVCNVTDYCMEEVSNHALALMFALHRNLFQYNSIVKEGGWKHILEKPIHRLSNLNVGLFGFGRIQKSVAKKLVPFGCNISAVRRSIPAGEYCEGVKIVTFDGMIESSDIIIINSALNEETKHIFNYNVFKKMKKHSIIINTSRGPIIKEDDLIKALQEKEIAGAGLDVFEEEGNLYGNPLTEMDNVICTPHVAYYSETSVNELRNKVAEEAVRVLKGEKPASPVNNI